jgi:hypothetical protein
VSAKRRDFGVHGRSTGDGEDAATQRQHWGCAGKRHLAVPVGTQRQHWRCPDSHLAVAVAIRRGRWGRESMGLVVQVGGLGSLNVSGGQRDWPEVLEMMRLKLPLKMRLKMRLKMPLKRRRMRMRNLVNVLDLLFSINGSISCTLRLSH